VFPYLNVNDVSNDQGEQAEPTRCTAQTYYGKATYFDLSAGGALRGVIGSFPMPHLGWKLASLHELGHEWMFSSSMFDYTQANSSASSGAMFENNEFYYSNLDFRQTNYGHWGFTMMDKHGMLGGFDYGSFKCESPAGQIPSKETPCDTDRLAEIVRNGSPRTAHDGNGGYSQAELVIMGLKTANEVEGSGIDGATSLVYCEDGTGSHDSITGTIHNVECNPLRYYSIQELSDSLTEAALGEQLSPNSEPFRTVNVAVFDGSEDMPTTAAEMTDEKWLGYVEFIDGYGDKLTDLYSEATEGRSSMVYGATEADKLNPEPTDNCRPRSNTTTCKKIKGLRRWTVK
jgi:hypothetical protein